MSMIGSIDRWWRAGAPAERLALVRLAVGGYAVLFMAVSVPSLLRLAGGDPSRFEPVGLACALSGPPTTAQVVALLVATFLLGAAFLLGWHYRITAPLFATGCFATLSYRSSWGHIGHGEHLVMMHVLLLAAFPAADRLSLDARAGRRVAGDPERYGWPLRLLMLTVVLSYMLAGLAKLRLGGWGWISGEIAREQIAVHALRTSRINGSTAALAELLISQRWIFAPIAIGTLAAELGAFVALREGSLRNLWLAAVWMMHLGIALTMTIVFGYPVSGAAFACFLPLERVLRWRRRRAAPRSD